MLLISRLNPFNVVTWESDWSKEAMREYLMNKENQIQHIITDLSTLESEYLLKKSPHWGGQFSKYIDTIHSNNKQFSFIDIHMSADNDIILKWGPTPLDEGHYSQCVFKELIGYSPIIALAFRRLRDSGIVE